MLPHEIKVQWFEYVGRVGELIYTTRMCLNKLKIIFIDT